MFFIMGNRQEKDIDLNHTLSLIGMRGFDLERVVSLKTRFPHLEGYSITVYGLCLG